VKRKYRFKTERKYQIRRIGAILLLLSLSAGIMALTSSKEPKQIESSTEVKKIEEAEKEPRELLTELSNMYAIDPRLVIAISRLETGNWTSEIYERCNNFGGMEIDGKPIAYGSKKEGAKAFVQNLYENYILEGKMSPKQMSHKYCPPNAELWARQVAEIMGEENERL